MRRFLAVLLVLGLAVTVVPATEAEVACGPGEPEEFARCLVQSSVDEARYLVCQLWKDEPRPIFC